MIEKNVEIILGPFFSSSLESITNIAKYNKIPIISFSNDYKIKDQGIYLMGFEPEKQIKRVLGISKIAIKSKLFPIISTVYLNAKIAKMAKRNRIEVIKIERDMNIRSHSQLRLR